MQPFLVCKLCGFVRMLNTNTVSVQFVSTIVVVFVQCCVKAWLFNNVRDICSSTQSSHFTCPHNKVFFSASAIWCVSCSMGSPWRSFIYFHDQGPYWPQSTVGSWLNLQPTAVCDHRGRTAPTSILAHAAAETRLVGQVCEHTRCAVRGDVYPARSGNQLLVLVCSRVRVPIPHS